MGATNLCPQGMVRVAGGSVVLPSAREELSEKTRGEERIDVASFCYDRAPVTRRELSQYVAAHPGTFQLPAVHKAFDQPNFPAVNVTQEEANAYCTSKGKRLSTEAEYQRAASGPKGDEYGRLALRFKSDAPTNVCATGRNGFKLCDMAGLLWEWSADLFVKSEEHPRKFNMFVVRGGHWSELVLAPPTQAAGLVFQFSTNRSLRIGFRCAASLPEKS